MASLDTTLYPPIVETYQPTFIITSDATVKIYFALSSYNTLSEIAAVQLSLTGQKTNSEVLSSVLYPTGIKVFLTSEIKEDTTRTSSDKYYLEIKNSDLQNGFYVNQYYKAQLRFSSVAPPLEGTAASQKIDSWITQNTDYFSEWSTVTLVHGISQPTVSLNGITDGGTYTSDTLVISGKLSFEDSAETEILKQYQIKLYDSGNSLVADSGIIYCDTYQGVKEFNATLNYLLSEGVYTLTLEYGTNNLYSETLTYNLTVSLPSDTATVSTLDIEENPEKGSFILTFTKKDSRDIAVIRRTSSQTLFQTWETIHEKDISSISSFVFEDNTIEAGVWYKYGVQTKTGNTYSLMKVINEEPKMIIFDNLFIVGDGKQLRLKYDANITSYSRTLSETKTETLGSQYPFIRRNGSINYRTFAITGLITLHTDLFTETVQRQDSTASKAVNTITATSFTSEDELYGNKEIAQLYKKYNQEKGITTYNDFVYERELREKIIDYLCSDAVRLMRSLPEGNVLVRLMNVQLSPKTQLGRMIYSFTANAYEVADYTVENLKTYNIL